VLLEQQIAPLWRVSGNVNWFTIEMNELHTTLLFPTARPFNLAGSRNDTWDFTISNLLQLPSDVEARVGHTYFAARNVPQGRQHARSSLDLVATWPIVQDRPEIAFTFTDMLNDFAVRTDVQGEGFSALYENSLETQLATVRLRLRY